MSSQQNDANFHRFNEERTALANHFRSLIGILGNQVFSGQIDLNKQNLIEEINQQGELGEAEKGLLRNLYYYVNNLTASRFLLGVLGRFKAGKSTLLNALAGEYISPSDTRISTGVLNFTYLNDQEECFVAFDNGEEKKIEPSEKVEYVSYLKNPDNEKGVHSVRHGSPYFKLQPEIIFVDTPGLEAVNSIHEKITLDFVTQCHAAIVVSTYPPFGSGELQFYQQIKESIRDIFLVQNLPQDKLADWVALETQTLENLHKLKFYEINTKKYSKEVGQLLREIGNKNDAQALAEFKKDHGIHLYSLNALAANRLLLEKDRKQLSSAEQQQLADSRFTLFQDDLYHFLSEDKGKKLIENYLSKGRLILGELLKMLDRRKSILEKTLEEIQLQIDELHKEQQHNQEVIEMTVDRTNLKMVELYKDLKSKLMSQDFAHVMSGLEEEYGDVNVYRLSKAHLKKIKAQLSDFNRLFIQRHREFIKQAQQIISQATDDIAAKLPHQGLFSAIEVPQNSPTIGMGEISGAGYIDYGFAILFRGGMAYFAGSLAVAAVGTAALPAAVALVGGAIGFGLSFPLEKRCAPFLDKCKELVGKVANKPTRDIFEDFRNRIRQKLDEIEENIVDNLVINFRRQVEKNARDAYELYEKDLTQLKEKKEHGKEQTEAEKLHKISEQLREMDNHFAQLEGASAHDESKLGGMLKGLRGFVKKFGK